MDELSSNLSLYLVIKLAKIKYNNMKKHIKLAIHLYSFS